MTSNPIEPPADLMARVAADLEPVRPLGPGWRRAPVWLAAGLVLGVAAPFLVGVRADAIVLGPALTVGASMAQWMLGVWLLWAGAREARPGRRLPLRLTTVGLCAAALLIVALTAMTFTASPTTLGRLLPGTAAMVCFGGHLLLGLPMLFIAGVLLGRALPGQPWLAGALFGAGAGLAADASWRLVCPISDPWHVLPTHGSAVLLLAAVGSATGYLAARRSFGGNKPL